MYKVRLTNFNEATVGSFGTIEEALERARWWGFEAAVFKDDELVAAWSPIYGERRFFFTDEDLRA